MREVTGRSVKQTLDAVEGITVQVLNDHYATISRDREYQVSSKKQTASSHSIHITEEEVFRILDRLKPTATGLDGIPAWYLRLGAAVFSAPIADLFNRSMSAGVVPIQWKKAISTPVPNQPSQVTTGPYRSLQCCHGRSRVHKHIYPALQEPPEGLDFNDQFGFRPTGSTRAALIALGLQHIVLSILSTNAYVRVFALDFSKAFDTVRHAVLMEKMAKLCISDEVYNWIKDFFDNHSHCIKYSGKISAVSKPISTRV